MKLSDEDIVSLEHLSIPSTGDKIFGSPTQSNSPNFSTYLELLKRDFVFTKSSKLIFRNEKYYFLFDSVGFTIENSLTSINDFNLDAVNIDQFSIDIVRHYNSVDQHLKIFSKVILDNFRTSLQDSKSEFQDELNALLSPQSLNELRDLIGSKALTTGIAQFDKMYSKQWEDTISELESLLSITNRFAVSGTDEDLLQIVEFLSVKVGTLEHAKIEFGIDVDAVFNRYFIYKPNRIIKKMLLGLLDAKINILAFCQNVAQIITSEQFLNTDFSGSLVFSQSQVRHLKNISLEEFSNFKKRQETLTNRAISIGLLREMDECIGFYMDVLMEDNSIGFVKMFGTLIKNTPDLKADPHDSIPSILKGTLLGLYNLFSLINLYVQKCETSEDSRVRKKILAGKSAKKSEAHLHVKNTAIRKIIRIYREENDPLVMIKTAQNALNHILEKDFNPDHDILHMMSVNYGGCLVGLFAKHSFSRTIQHGRILCNPGNLVYSIYDVKNANSFSRLADYPFSLVLRDKTVTEESKNNLFKRNWLLAFDDNTNSGQTLDDIRILAEESGFFSRIDLFPCRASSIQKNYRREIPENYMLAMMANCAVIARKSCLNPNGIRYKEKLGTIIGNRIFKIMTSRQST